MTRMEDIVERGYVIIGSPEEVVEQLTELATDLNDGHLMLLMQFGSMAKTSPPTTPSSSPTASSAS
jgi:alkanesulfonate monooxygenase SsuD/methylene tetrahydromethanopterin reductase-like flavin-dependent oxidoreductase (luciferase family)